MSSIVVPDSIEPYVGYKWLKVWNDLLLSYTSPETCFARPADAKAGSDIDVRPGGNTLLHKNKGGHMPGKDLTRWTENADGSWTRIVEDHEDDRDNVNATQGALDAAEKLGVDLASVTGTGKDGKITKADVESYAA